MAKVCSVGGEVRWGGKGPHVGARPYPTVSSAVCREQGSWVLGQE